MGCQGAAGFQLHLPVPGSHHLLVGTSWPAVLGYLLCIVVTGPGENVGGALQELCVHQPHLRVCARTHTHTAHSHGHSIVFCNCLASVLHGSFPSHRPQWGLTCVQPVRGWTLGTPSLWPCWAM